MTHTQMFFEESEKEPVDIYEDDTLSTCPSGIERDGILVVATLGEIHAVRKEDGSHLWRRLYPTGAGGGVVSLFITDQDKLIAGATGKTASIDLFTGQTLWLNQMKGCGYEEVGTIATPSRDMSFSRDSWGHQDADRDDSPPEYASTVCSGKQEGASEAEPQLMIACTGGKCMAIDLETGEDLWVFKCPDGGFKLSTALVDPPVRVHQDRQDGGMTKIYVGCGTMLYCLHAHSGEVAWRIQITNSWKGFDYLTMATAWSSRYAAVALPGYNQFPSAHQEHAIRTRRNGFPAAAVNYYGDNSVDSS